MKVVRPKNVSMKTKLSEHDYLIKDLQQMHHYLIKDLQQMHLKIKADLESLSKIVMFDKSPNKEMRDELKAEIREIKDRIRNLHSIEDRGGRTWDDVDKMKERLDKLENRSRGNSQLENQFEEGKMLTGFDWLEGFYDGVRNNPKKVGPKLYGDGYLEGELTRSQIKKQEKTANGYNDGYLAGDLNGFDKGIKVGRQEGYQSAINAIAEMKRHAP